MINLLLFGISIRVGGVLLMSGDGSAPGNILQQLAASFGTHANSQAKKAESAMGTANPANEGIIMALSELSQVCATQLSRFFFLFLFLFICFI